jgi:hypothetical protein
MKTSDRTVRALAAGLMLIAWPVTAAEQQYPSRPVENLRGQTTKGGNGLIWLDMSLSGLSPKKETAVNLAHAVVRRAGRASQQFRP